MAAACFVDASKAELRAVKEQLEAEKRYTQEQIDSFLATGKVRRYIPSPVLLAQRLVAVMEKFSSLRDPRNQVPVINAQTWHTFLVNLKKVQLGYLSGMFTNFEHACHDLGL